MKKLAFVSAAIWLASCATAPVAPAPSPQPTPEPQPVARPVEPSKPAVEPAPPVLAFPQDEFRAKQPAPSGEARPLKLPAVTQFKLKNGVQVYLIEDHSLPKIDLSLEIDSGGSLSDPPGKEGRSRLCMATIADSTEKLDKVAFSEATNDLALRLGAGATSDITYFSLTSLSKNFDAGMGLFTDVILHPGLRAEDFSRNALALKAAIQQAKGNPQALAGMYMPQILFGAKHPLARVATDASIDAITLDDCKAYIADSVKPGGARLWIAGDITQAKIEALGDGLWKDWNGKAKPAMKIPAAKPEGGRVYFIDVPGAAQSAVYVMELGPSRKDSGYFASTVMTAILGGGFSSRINMLARETKGYAYGARGGFRYQRTFGTFVASGGIKTASTAESVTDFLGEINKMASTGEVTDEELNRERQNLILSLPAEFETPNDVLGAMSRLIYFGLPLNYYDTYVANAGKVDKKAVAGAAKKWLKPANLIIFVVGDAKVVRADLEKLHADGKLGKGKWITLDVDGKVVPESK